MLVTGSLLAGGTERIMADMANYWQRHGWDVTLATWAGPEFADFYSLERGVRRVWLDVHSANDSSWQLLCATVRRIIKLRNVLRQERPSVVLSFIDTSNILTILATTGLGVRVVISERVHAAHNFGISAVWRTLRRLLYRHADAVVAQTRDAASWLEKNCKVRTQVIPNPLRSLPDISGDREPLILAVGRLERQKGFDLLLQAFAGVADRFPEWRLVIIGAGTEADNLARIQNDLGLGDRIRLLAPVKDVESWMSRASLVVQPSRFEGFPNVVLEAMGMGAAVISADCPSGPAELIEDGVNGRLVPVEDVGALVVAMTELMSDPHRRRQLGEQAQRVRQTYDQEKIMRSWELCVRGTQ